MPINVPIEITYEQMYDMRINQDLSIAKIAKMYFTSDSCIKNKCNRMGITTKVNIPEKHVLYDLYVTNVMSLDAIAKIYGVTIKTVSKWLEIYGIEKRAAPKKRETYTKRSELYASIAETKESEGIRREDCKCFHRVGDRVKLFAKIQDPSGYVKHHSRIATVYAKHRDHVVLQLDNYKVSIQNKDFKTGLAKMELIR